MRVCGCVRVCKCVFGINIPHVIADGKHRGLGLERQRARRPPVHKEAGLAAFAHHRKRVPTFFSRKKINGGITYTHIPLLQGSKNTLRRNNHVIHTRIHMHTHTRIHMHTHTRMHKHNTIKNNHQHTSHPHSEHVTATINTPSPLTLLSMNPVPKKRGASHAPSSGPKSVCLTCTQKKKQKEDQ